MRLLTMLVSAIAAGALLHAQSTSEETLAQRLYQQARTFAAQGNYREALGDFQRVVDTYPKSSVADNALLELARYHLEIGNDPARAALLVEQVKSNYLTTESAPEAFIIAGRVALARSHQPADLEAAFAQFDRVPGLFPDAPAVPAALTYAGEARRLARRLPDALERFQRVTTDYDTTPAAASAHLGTGMVLAAEGDYIGAMEEFQRVRNRWPESRESGIALGHSSVLYRLYVRAGTAPAYAPSPDPVGPPKADNVRAIVSTPRGAVYYATDTTVGLLTDTGERPPAVTRPRGLTLDIAGNLVVIEGNVLRPVTGTPLVLTIPQAGKAPRPLDKIDAAVVTSSGEWLVMDDDEKVINRFDATGKHLGPFAAAHVSRLAINEFDEVAGIDRDSKSIVVFDGSGKLLTRISPKGPGYEYTNPEDIRFDAFGHIYLLDRAAVLVFDFRKLVRAAGAAPPRTVAAAAAAQAANSPVLTIYSEGERNPTAFRRASAFALDSAGRMYIADDRAQKIQLYR